MSAIFGLIRFDGASPRDLERMGNVLAHRGPDGRKFVVDGSVGVGLCLMRVNQEDVFEAQPLHDHEADITLVADCRIDNREELAAFFGIGAAELRDMPDSALVMRAYKAWGERCAEHLIGDFAFAVWDGRAKRLLLGRDHLGQRYVHYYVAENFFVFATEIKALWACSDVPRKISDVQVGKYMVAESRPREGATFFEDIWGLPGGATLTVCSDASVSMRRYWQPRARSEHLGRDEQYYVAAYRTILAEAVECRIRRLIAPPALCLSAGYDSAAIAGLSGRILAAQSRKLIAVSSVLDDGDRRPSARRWVELCRRDMPHLDVHYFTRADETLFTNLEKALLTADGIPRVEQYATNALFGAAARAGAHMIMDGLGGDTTINPRGSGVLAHFLRSGQFARFFAEFRPHLRASRRTFAQALRRDVLWPLAPLSARRLWAAARRGFAAPWTNVPLTPAFADELMRTGAIADNEMMGRFWFENTTPVKARRLLRNWTEASRRADGNEAAAHGLDLTRPFFDKRVVEFGLAIPEDLYVKNGRNRYLACSALADIYPPEFQTRERQQDFLEPDYASLLTVSRPQLKLEIDRIGRNQRLRQLVDSEKLQARLGAPNADPLADPAVAAALHTFWAVQFVDWAERRNS